MQPKITIELSNAERLPITPRAVQTAQNVTLGHALYDGQKATHTLAVPLELFLQHAKQLGMAAKRPASTWYVSGLKVEDAHSAREEELATALDAANAKIKRLEENIDLVVNGTEAEIVFPEPEQEEDAASRLDKMTYRELRSVAKERGVPNFDAYKTSTSLRAAILTRV